MNRLLVAETGLSFGRWRQQLQVLLTIQKMSRGATVESVAFDLGYQSSSSFVTMFRKNLGTSPARYMAHRLAISKDQQLAHYIFVIKLWVSRNRNSSLIT